jgi:hypothetical protein
MICRTIFVNIAFLLVACFLLLIPIQAQNATANEPQNLLLNPDASQSSNHWIPSGDAIVERSLLKAFSRHMSRYRTSEVVSNGNQRSFKIGGESQHAPAINNLETPWVSSSGRKLHLKVTSQQFLKAGLYPWYPPEDC